MGKDKHQVFQILILYQLIWCVSGMIRNKNCIIVDFCYKLCYSNNSTYRIRFQVKKRHKTGQNRHETFK